MTGWRLELTVLTDLSASIFAVCFMVLLIFIAHAGSTAPARMAVVPAPAVIDAEQRFQIVERRFGGSSEMVAMLYRHGRSATVNAAEAGIGIDLFEDRIEVHAPRAGRTTVLAADAIEGRLSSVIARAGGSARLYVFSNALYAPTLAALAMPASALREMSVPRGLRDLEDEMRGWSPAFLDLGAERLDERAFRRRLAMLLEGSADRAPVASRPSGELTGEPTRSTEAQQHSVSSFWADQFDAFARRLALLMPIVGAAVAVWIRRHTGVVHTECDDVRQPAGGNAEGTP